MSEEMTQIAASEYLERGYMMGAVESGEVLKEGAEAFATSEGVLVEYAAESGYVWGELPIPWPDILKHAPVAALVAEMERRKFQVKSEDDQYNDWAEAREAEP